MQKLFLKYKDHWLFWFFTLGCGAILSRVISSLEIYSDDFSFIITILKIKVPLFGFLIAAITFLSFKYIFNKYYVFKKRKLIILKALYGKNEKYIDISNELNKAIVDNNLRIVLSNNISGDPIHGVKKEGIITYSFNKNKITRKYTEGDLIDLPSLDL